MTMRRQRATQQRNQSLQAALGSTGGGASRGEDASVQGSVTSNIRQRRARSLRVKVTRKGEGDVEATTTFHVDVKRAKSTKGRVEGEPIVKVEKTGKKIRRARSVEFDNMEPGEDGDADDFTAKDFGHERLLLTSLLPFHAFGSDKDVRSSIILPSVKPV